MTSRQQEDKYEKIRTSMFPLAAGDSSSGSDTSRSTVSGEISLSELYQKMVIDHGNMFYTSPSSHHDRVDSSNTGGYIQPDTRHNSLNRPKLTNHSSVLQQLPVATVTSCNPGQDGIISPAHHPPGPFITDVSVTCFGDHIQVNTKSPPCDLGAREFMVQNVIGQNLPHQRPISSEYLKKTLDSLNMWEKQAKDTYQETLQRFLSGEETARSRLGVHFPNPPKDRKPAGKDNTNLRRRQGAMKRLT